MPETTTPSVPASTGEPSVLSSTAADAAGGMKILREGVAGAAHDKALEYAQRIVAGEDPKTLGINPSFRTEVQQLVDKLKNPEGKQSVAITIDDGTGNGSVLVPKTDIASMTLDGKPLTNIQFKKYDPDNVPVGVEGARLGKKQIDKTTGNAEYKPFPYNQGETVTVTTDDVVLLRQQDGTDARFPLFQFTLESGTSPEPPVAETKPTPAAEPTIAPGPSRDEVLHGGEPEPEETSTEPSPEPTPKPTPLSALTDRATTPLEVPRVISIFALDDDPTKQALAMGISEKIAMEGGNKFKKILRGIWKGNVALELLQENDYQYRNKLEAASHIALTDKGIAYIKERVNTVYDEAMSQKTKLGRGLLKLKDKIAENLGIDTTKQKLGVIEAADLTVREQLNVIEQHESKAEANKIRLETFNNESDAVRKNLGEYVEIIASDDPRHKTIVNGIKDLALHYANGDKGFETKLELQAALDKFAREQGVGKDTKTGKETQLYASSLYQIAEAIKQRVASGEGMTTIDATFDAIEVRIGRAQMGAATHVESSTTRKIMEKILQKNVMSPFVTNNEATLGTIVAGITSLAILPRTALSRAARLGFGAVGGGAVAGGVTYLKENKRLFGEWLKSARDQELGITPDASDKARKWMIDRQIPQTPVTELMSRMVDVAYEGGKIKTDLPSEDLTKTLAYLADAKARRALSARGGENISLIQWGPAVDVSRTNLDLSIDRLEKDLLATYSGQNISDRLKLFTDTQTLILTRGRDAANLSDPLKTALYAVKDDDIAVEKFRRKLGIWGEAKSKGKAQGLDEALKDIKTQIRWEAARRGVTAGAIGTAIGTALSEASYVASHPGQVAAFWENALHIGHGAGEIPVPTHLADVPNLVHMTDAQGIDHAIQAAIPEHTSLVGDNATHTFTLMDDHNHALLRGIAINDHGQITNADALNSNHEAIEHGLHIGDNTPIVLPGTEHLSPSDTVDLHTSEWGPGGFWQYAQEKLSGQTLEYHNAATNASMQVLRGYELHFGMDPSHHVTNIDVNPPAGFVQNVQYHDTIWGKEVYFNAMPNTATIHVPASLFSDQSIINLGHAADEAAKQYNDGLSHGLTSDQILAGMDRLHQIAFKIGYHGMEADIPTKEELQYLMDHLGGAQGTPEITLYQGLIEQTAATGVLPAAEALVTDLPAVVPLPREGMKTGKPTKPIPKPEPPPERTREKGKTPKKGEISDLTPGPLPSGFIPPPTISEEEELRHKKSAKSKTAAEPSGEEMPGVDISLPPAPEPAVSEEQELGKDKSSGSQPQGVPAPDVKNQSETGRPPVGNELKLSVDPNLQQAIDDMQNAL